MSTEWTGYNARHSSIRAIAESFVVPTGFEEITRFQNSILVGPRGSGKTTILKILTPEGLHHFGQRIDLEQDKRNLQVDYLPVYIPADATWKADAVAVQEAIPALEARRQVLNGIYVDHTLHWFIQAIESARAMGQHYTEGFLPHWTAKISDDQEEELARSLSSSWRLRRIQTSFVGLKLALNDRINTLNGPIVAPSAKNLDKALDLPTLDVFQMLKSGMDAYDVVESGRRWGFNFDEMEIAPRHFVSRLYENLRSWDQRAVLKFSLFPYVDFYTHEQRRATAETAPGDGPDYTVYPLTNLFHRQASPFTTNLIAAECAKRSVDAGAFAAYLNSSRGIKRNTRTFEGTRSVRNFGRIFEDVYSQRLDPGLTRFLKERGFHSAQELVELEGEVERASNIRKIAPLVEFRSYYLSEQRAKAKAKSRRSSPKGFGYYHGYSQIAALTENNPRAVKFYVNELLDLMAAGANSSAAQNRVIARNVDRFCALVASQLVPQEPGPDPIQNALHFADRLAQLFVREVLDETFKPEPSLSVVFKSPPEQLKRIIEVAINAGALVVDYQKTIYQLIFDVSEHRFRLSHSFAPRHPLPTITGPELTLNRVPNVDPLLGKQPDLFAWVDDD